MTLRWRRSRSQMAKELAGPIWEWREDHTALTHRECRCMIRQSPLSEKGQTYWEAIACCTTIMYLASPV
jgi:hypothetical protein